MRDAKGWMVAFASITDIDGKTIEDMLRRVPSLQALPLDVQKKC